MEHDHITSLSQANRHIPWNKDKLVGAKPPLRPSHVWSTRTKLQMEGKTRDLALFNLAIDSKLRGCDVVAIRVEDFAPNGYALSVCAANNGRYRRLLVGARPLTRRVAPTRA